MSDFFSLIFYIFFFFLTVIFYYLCVKYNKKVYLIISFIIPMLIGGLRYDVGTDYMSYLEYYINHIDIDIGFTIISLVARLFDNFKVMFFTYNFLTLIFVYLALNNISKQNRSAALFLFLFLYFTTGFNAIRQMLAVAILFYSYKYIVNKSFIKYLLFVMLASVFHSSAIITIIVYPIVISDNKFVKFIIYVSLITFIIFFEKMILFISNINYFSHYSIYISYTDSIKFNNLSFFIEMFFLLYVLRYKSKMIKYNPSNKYYLSLYFIGVLLMLTGFINPYAKRMSIYFTISSVFLLSSMPCIFKNSKDRLLNYILIFGFTLLRFIITVYILHQSKIIPYAI